MNKQMYNDEPKCQNYLESVISRPVKNRDLLYCKTETQTERFIIYFKRHENCRNQYLV